MQEEELCAVESPGEEIWEKNIEKGSKIDKNLLR